MDWNRYKVSLYPTRGAYWERRICRAEALKRALLAGIEGETDWQIIWSLLNRQQRRRPLGNI